MRIPSVVTFFAISLLGLVVWTCPGTWRNAGATENVHDENGEDDNSAETTKIAKQRAVDAAKRRLGKKVRKTADKKSEKPTDGKENIGTPLVTPLVRTSAPPKDVVPGFLTLSDGSTIAGSIFLTRDKRVKIEDKAAERQREIPLSAIVSIETIVDREWMEDEWRFRENANNEKYFTGRSYPSRIFRHLVTLRNGRKIEGALSEVIYVDPAPELVYPDMSASEVASKGLSIPTRRFLLHKRDKGEPGETLEDLSYVKLIRLGEDTMEEGLRKAGKSPIREKKTEPAAKKAGRS
ncbi:MAG: hypothetical protein Q4C47_04725 [Planctomycetia bacterium]|nr:hypothetical protein [Planctomycetia bacterium]